MQLSAAKRLGTALTLSWIAVGVGLVLEFIATVGITSGTPTTGQEAISHIMSGIPAGPGKEAIAAYALLSQFGAGLFYLGLAMLLVVFIMKLIAAVFRPEALKEDLPPNFGGG